MYHCPQNKCQRNLYLTMFFYSVHRHSTPNRISTAILNHKNTSNMKSSKFRQINQQPISQLYENICAKFDETSQSCLFKTYKMKFTGWQACHPFPSEASFINPLRAKFFKGNKNNIFTFYVIPPHWHDTGCWNPFSSNIRTYLFYIHVVLISWVLMSWRR